MTTSSTNPASKSNVPTPAHWDEWALEQSKLMMDQVKEGRLPEATLVSRLHELLIAAMEYANPDTKVSENARDKSTADYAFDSAMLQMQGMYSLMREFSIPASRAANCAAHVESAIRTLHRESKVASSAERDQNALDAKRHRYARVTTTAVRDPATGERIVVTPAMYDAAIDSAMEADPAGNVGIKAQHLVEASKDFEGSPGSEKIDMHPAYFSILDDIFTPQGWTKYHADERIALYPESLRDIFEAGLNAGRAVPGSVIPERISQKWLVNIAQEAGFNLNMVDQLVVPAPHSDATPYLRRLIKLVASNPAQQTKE